MSKISKIFTALVISIRLFFSMIFGYRFYAVISKQINERDYEFNFFPFGFNAVDILGTNKWLTEMMFNGKISIKYDTTIKVEPDETNLFLEIVEIANDPNSLKIKSEL